MPAPNFAASERLIHDLERRQRESQERIRSILREEGRDDLVIEFDTRMRDVETGTYYARSVWHSLSDAQRAALANFLKAGNSRFRRAGNQYVVDGSGVPLRRPVRLPTIRKLEAHGLVDWDGGAFDPEAAAVLNEQGRFVFAKGRTERDEAEAP